MTNIRGQHLKYPIDGVQHVAYLAWDDSQTGARPGVIVIHEWWGLTDHIRQRADRLAAEGFCVLALDMYGAGKTAQNPEEAGVLMNAVLGDMDTGTRKLEAGYEQLLKQPKVDASKTAAIGYCFGGAMVLHMARIGMPLDAVVSFHGALGSFHQPQPDQVRAQLLVCHGRCDEMVSMEDVAAFEKEMDAVNASYDVIVYETAQHGFTNPAADENGRKYGLPLGYDAHADTASWKAMISLFRNLF